MKRSNSFLFGLILFLSITAQGQEIVVYADSISSVAEFVKKKGETIHKITLKCKD